MTDEIRDESFYEVNDTDLLIREAHRDIIETSWRKSMLQTFRKRFLNRRDSRERVKESMGKLPLPTVRVLQKFITEHVNKKHEIPPGVLQLPKKGDVMEWSFFRENLVDIHKIPYYAIISVGEIIKIKSIKHEQAFSVVYDGNITGYALNHATVKCVLPDNTHWDAVRDDLLFSFKKIRLSNNN